MQLREVVKIPFLFAWLHFFIESLFFRSTLFRPVIGTLKCLTLLSFL
jgi:hypothetical protein